MEWVAGWLGAVLRRKPGFVVISMGKIEERPLQCLHLGYDLMECRISIPVLLNPHQLNQLVILRSGFPTLAVNIKNAKHDFSTDDKK